MAAISLRDVTLSYGGTPVVQQLNTDIDAGSLTAIVGPNGAGKSTLLKAIAGNLRPQTGSVTLGTGRRENAFAYLPQQSDIDRSFPISVADLVAMGLWREIGPLGRVSRRHWQRIDSAIAAVGLTGFERRTLDTLSGGQMQRVLFARLLLQDADIVLLDEPFNAIDANTIGDLLGVIARWHGEGRTILAVLHDMDLVRGHFPHTLMLARHLIAHGATDAVLNASNLMRARHVCEACLGPPHSCGRTTITAPWATSAEPGRGNISRLNT